MKANDDKANFDNRANLADADDNYSGGLLFIGLCLNNARSLFIRGSFANRRASVRFLE